MHHGERKHTRKKKKKNRDDNHKIISRGFGLECIKHNIFFYVVINMFPLAVREITHYLWQWQKCVIYYCSTTTWCSVMPSPTTSGSGWGISSPNSSSFHLLIGSNFKVQARPKVARPMSTPKASCCRWGGLCNGGRCSWIVVSNIERNKFVGYIK